MIKNYWAARASVWRGMAGVTIIRAVRMDLPSPPALIYNTQSFKKGLSYKGRNSWVAHSHIQRGRRSTGNWGKANRESAVFVQLWGGSPGEVAAAGFIVLGSLLLPQRKRAAGFLFLGLFWTYSMAKQNGIWRLIHTSHKTAKGWENKPVNNKLLWSLFQHLTSHFSHRINDQLKHCTRMIQNCSNFAWK